MKEEVLKNGYHMLKIMLEKKLKDDSEPNEIVNEDLLELYSTILSTLYMLNILELDQILLNDLRNFSERNSIIDKLD